MSKHQDNQSIISYLAAIAPALLQLIAVLSVGLVDVLNFKEFVFAPRFINIANFLVILLAISIISLASFWDYNKFPLANQGDDIFSQTRKFWKTLKVFCLLSIAGFVVFLGIVLTKNAITHYKEWFTFFQWASYIVSMVSISFIIYSFVLLKIQEKNNQSLQENFIPRLLDSLRRYGHVRDPDIVIHSINRETQEAIVKLGGASTYRVKMDFTGEMLTIEGLKNSYN